MAAYDCTIDPGGRNLAGTSGQYDIPIAGASGITVDQDYWDFDGTSNATAVSPTGYDFAGETGRISVFAEWIPNQDTAFNLDHLFHINTGHGSTLFLLRTRNQSSNREIHWNVRTTTGGGSGSSATISSIPFDYNNSFNTGIFRHRPSRRDSWLNGHVGAANTDSRALGTSTPTYFFRIGTDSAGNESNAQFRRWYIWNRYLTDQECYWLSGRPDFFAKRPTTVWFGSGAAGTTVPIFDKHYRQMRSA